jgi:uncharacterized protein with FMN-binding domain
MKKLVVFIVVIFTFGYILFQNGPLWFLKLLSLTSLNPVVTRSNTSTSSQNQTYKDGTFTGNPADAFYGNIQVQAIISGGKITDIQFLQYPNDRSRSIAINTISMPILKQEAIQAQNANVNVVSGATDSSNAFVQSLSSALAQAK